MRAPPAEIRAWLNPCGGKRNPQVRPQEITRGSTRAATTGHNRTNTKLNPQPARDQANVRRPADTARTLAPPPPVRTRPRRPAPPTPGLTPPPQLPRIRAWRRTSPAPAPAAAAAVTPAIRSPGKLPATTSARREKPRLLRAGRAASDVLAAPRTHNSEHWLAGQLKAPTSARQRRIQIPRHHPQTIIRRPGRTITSPPAITVPPRQPASRRLAHCLENCSSTDQQTHTRPPSPHPAAPAPAPTQAPARIDCDHPATGPEIWALTPVAEDDSTTKEHGVRSL